MQVWLEPLGLKLAETRVVDDNLNPSWKEVFHIMSCFDAEKIRVVVKDSDMSWTAAVMSICPSISRFVYISAQPKQINITWLIPRDGFHLMTTLDHAKSQSLPIPDIWRKSLS